MKLENQNKKTYGVVFFICLFCTLSKITVYFLAIVMGEDTEYTDCCYSAAFLYIDAAW